MIKYFIFREEAQEASDFPDIGEVSCFMEVVDEQGGVLDDKKVHNVEIDALEEFLVAFDEVEKLMFQQFLKILQLLAISFEVLAHIGIE